MSNAFEFATAARIIFGAGKLSQVAEIAASFGKSVLLVSSKTSSGAAAQIEQITQKLAERGIKTTSYSISGEPDIAAIEGGLATARQANCDQVIAVGGGSVIDAGKAISGLLTNGGELLDYVEVIGRGKALQHPAAPYIAIPTTAGTGAEVTRNAVITVKDRAVKVSLRSPYLLPRVALVDPELTYSMPPEVTASTGLDALTQLIEAYTCNRTNLITDALATTGLSRATKSILEAYKDGTPEAREDMAYASLCSGLALANAGLGAVHGFAAVLGGRYPIPHGVCCAALLPYVVMANIGAILSRDHNNPAMARYTRIAILVTGGQDARLLPDTLKTLCDQMAIPRLSSFGVTQEAIPELVAQSQQASSMKANPIVLTPDELAQTLSAAL